MEPRKLSASELVTAIRSKSNYADLMDQYSLSGKQLDAVFKKLVDRGVIDQRELPIRDEHGISREVSRLPAPGLLPVQPRRDEILSTTLQCPKPEWSPEHPERPRQNASPDFPQESSVNWAFMWLRTTWTSIKKGVLRVWAILQEKKRAAEALREQKKIAAQLAKEEQQRAENQQIEDWLKNGPPPIEAPIILKKGECAHYASDVAVLQQKTQKKTYRAYAGTRMKVFNMPIYVGGSSPHTVSEEAIVPVGSGLFVLTNKRVALVGAKINYSIKLDKINGIQLYRDSVQIFDEGSRGGRFYRVGDPRHAAMMLGVLLERQ